MSYDEKHNEANGEHNRDGTDNNRSWNCGVEGETDDPDVLALRHRQAANLMATLCLSNGVPMITAGDERGRTQGGNNNPYCQDNEISWIDWRPTTRGSTSTRSPGRRCGSGASTRRCGSGTGSRGGPTIDGGPKDLAWLHPEGREMTGDDWHDDGLRRGRDVRLRRPAALARTARRAAATTARSCSG